MEEDGQQESVVTTDNILTSYSFGSKVTPSAPKIERDFDWLDSRDISHFISKCLVTINCYNIATDPILNGTYLTGSLKINCLKLRNELSIKCKLTYTHLHTYIQVFPEISQLIIKGYSNPFSFNISLSLTYLLLLSDSFPSW